MIPVLATLAAAAFAALTFASWRHMRRRQRTCQTEASYGWVGDVDRLARDLADLLRKAPPA